MCTSFCIHQTVSYDFSEYWCKLNHDSNHSCSEDCPYRYSEEDFLNDKADLDYEDYFDRRR